jgi:hypothetical protein
VWPGHGVKLINAPMEKLKASRCGLTSWSSECRNFALPARHAWEGHASTLEKVNCAPQFYAKCRHHPTTNPDFSVVKRSYRVI